LGEVLQGYPKVLIAAVHGAAIGWGCTQLFNFDLVYAHPQSFFQTPFMSLGFAPEGASSYSFPKVMGKQHANRLLLGAERVSASDMYTSGYVTQVIGDSSDSRETFLTKVGEIAKRIGGFNGESLRMCKALVNRPTTLGEQREAGMREGADLKVRLNSPETKAMVAAFANKPKKNDQSSKL
jgi:Delta3-Delta2-enoyl-CoA isomerase